MPFLLDTNAVISVLNDPASRVSATMRRQRPSDVVISAIVAHELYFGAFRSQRRQQNLERLDALRFETLAFDKEDAVAAGEIRAALRSIGQPIGPYDVLIAGQALARQLTLVTANLSEFQRIPDLKIVDWANP